MKATPKKFRKKPVVIEAIQFDPNKPWSEQGVIAVGSMNDPMIATLEGPMLVRAGDWIITGVKGELYPCKPDIFEMTYEEVGICGRCSHTDEDHWDEGPCGFVALGQTESGDVDDCACPGFVEKSAEVFMTNACAECGLEATHSKVCPVFKRMEYLIEMAWPIIASAGPVGCIGNWEKMDLGWVKAAERWRDKYHEYLSSEKRGTLEK